MAYSKSLAFDNKGSMYIAFSAPTYACEDWTSVTGTSYAGEKGYYPYPLLDDLGGIWRFDKINKDNIKLME